MTRPPHVTAESTQWRIVADADTVQITQEAHHGDDDDAILLRVGELRHFIRQLQRIARGVERTGGNPLTRSTRYHARQA